MSTLKAGGFGHERSVDFGQGRDRTLLGLSDGVLAYMGYLPIQRGGDRHFMLRCLSWMPAILCFRRTHQKRATRNGNQFQLNAFSQIYYGTLSGGALTFLRLSVGIHNQCVKLKLTKI
ncbi:hypothetical protein [Leptothermofonsia sp. ETS-13]|uniref:hypothetical protein n=1 Tax=Leptothermofonsia sp. ETS-13 TaxID=3035696 RepID=UPI003BA27198